MIGIYKITNPNNKIYIGQSINVEKRFLTYMKYNCKSQIKLYNSLKKYTVENHIFEIIEQCNINELNVKERHYQEKYDAVESGLNCIYTKTNDKSGKISENEKQNRIFKNKIKQLTANENIYSEIINKENIIEFENELLDWNTEFYTCSLLDLKYINHEYSTHYDPYSKKYFIKKEKLFNKISAYSNYILYDNPIQWKAHIESEVFMQTSKMNNEINIFKCEYGYYEIKEMWTQNNQLNYRCELFNKLFKDDIFDFNKGEIQPLC